MRKANRIARWSVIPLSLLLLLGLALAGCGGGTNISDILKKSEEAGAKITSMNQVVELIYESSQFGTGTMQSRSVTISGTNVQASETVLGATIAEKILVNGKQYTKTYPDNTWVEETATLNPSTSAATGTGQYANLVSNSTSQKDMGMEVVNGYNCYHFQFELSPENVKSMVQQVSAQSLSANTGGTVDIWIDEETLFMIKSEGVFRNVSIPDVAQLGLVNLKIIITRSNINQAIVITPPV